MEGHFTDYLIQRQEKYEEIRNSGRDLHYSDKTVFKQVFALPDKSVKYAKDGSVEITPEIKDILKQIFGEREIYLITHQIFPYRKEEETDKFTLASLEKIAEGGHVEVKQIPR